MNSHTLSESKNHKSIDYTKKSDENTHNISWMENTGLQDGVDIGVMLPEYTINQYTNMEYNNEYNYLFMNVEIKISKSS